MIICQVDARAASMGKEDIEQELRVIGNVLAAIGGELIDADISMRHGHIVAYVRAESELVVNDIFEASFFSIDQIVYLGPIHAAQNEGERAGSSLNRQGRHELARPRSSAVAVLKPFTAAWLGTEPAFG